MNDPLSIEINEHLKKLRSCDTQATAVNWMTRSYLLMERCIHELENKPIRTVEVVRERIVIVPASPQIQVVQEVPAGAILAHRRALGGMLPGKANWFNGKTVVYPELPMPPEQPKPPAEPLSISAGHLPKWRIQRLGK